MALSIGELVGYVDLDTGPAEKATDRLGSLFGSASSSWGKTLAKGGAVAGALFGASLAGAIAMEPSRDRVAAALDLTTAEAERAGKVSGALYADAWGQSAADVDAAVEAVMSSIKGMRGASEGELAAVTEAALTIADTMQVDVTRAAQVAGNMVANGLAKNGADALDMLASAMSDVPVQLREDLMDATDEYGQFFNQVGIKGPEAMAMLAKGADQGMYGIDKAGDAVKEFTIRATDMSAGTREAYGAIGLNAGKMADDLLAGGKRAGGATQSIVDGLLGIKDPTKQASAAIALFGTPLEDLGTKNIPTFLASLDAGRAGLDDWRGATERMGDTLTDNAATNLTSFTRQLKSGFVDLIGGSVLPKVTELSGSLSDSLGPALSVVAGNARRTARWLGQHSTVAKVLAGVLTGLVAITAAHSAVLAVGAAGGLVAWLKGTRLVSGATKVWAAVQWALNAALLANPLVALAVVLAAVVAALVIAYKRSDKFRAVVNAAFNAVRNVVGKVLVWFIANITKVVSKARSVWSKLVAFFRNPMENSRQIIQSVWGKIEALVKKGVDKVVGFVRSIPGRFRSGLSSLGSTVRGVFSSAMDRALDTVRDLGGRIVDWISSIPGKLANLGGRFASAGRSLLQGFIDGMKNAAGIISGIAGNVWNAVRGLLNGAISRINAALTFTINLPGKDLSINPPNIPYLATGGRVDGATLAMIGEGAEAETVLPDSVLRGLLERVHAAGQAQGDRGRDGVNIGAVYQQPDESTERFAERLWFKTRTRG